MSETTKHGGGPEHYLVQRRNGSGTVYGGTWPPSHDACICAQADGLVILPVAPTPPTRGDQAEVARLRISGEALYAAFWGRQPGGSRAPAWAEQSGAIRAMWAGIAADARATFSAEPQAAVACCAAWEEYERRHNYPTDPEHTNAPAKTPFGAGFHAGWNAALAAAPVGVEDAIRHVRDRFPEWRGPTPSMLGFARAVAVLAAGSIADDISVDCDAYKTLRASIWSIIVRKDQYLDTKVDDLCALIAAPVTGDRDPSPCGNISCVNGCDGEPDLCMAALKRLTLAARTSGGTAGPDDELMAACEQAEAVLTGDRETAGVERANAEGLLSCPFCGWELIANATPEGHAEHPSHEWCPAGDFLVLPKDWNRRPQLEGVKPAAWKYELATAIAAGGEYCNWAKRLTAHKPCVPSGSIRNLTALYATPPSGGGDHASGEDDMAETAKSLASMVEEYVDGGIASGTDWRSGLKEIIQLRLKRFIQPKSFVNMRKAFHLWLEEDYGGKMSEVVWSAVYDEPYHTPMAKRYRDFKAGGRASAHPTTAAVSGDHAAEPQPPDGGVGFPRPEYVEALCEALGTVAGNVEVKRMHLAFNGEIRRFSTIVDAASKLIARLAQRPPGESKPEGEA